MLLAVPESHLLALLEGGLAAVLLLAPGGLLARLEPHPVHRPLVLRVHHHVLHHVLEREQRRLRQPDIAAEEEEVEVEAVTWLASLELGGSTTQSSSGSRDLAATPLPPPTPATPPMTHQTSQGYFLLSKINYTDTTVALL